MLERRAERLGLLLQELLGQIRLEGTLGDVGRRFEFLATVKAAGVISGRAFGPSSIVSREGVGKLRHDLSPLSSNPHALGRPRP